MAVIAPDVHVGAIQFEVRLHIVIEQPQVPRDRVVTGLTALFEQSLVGIILAMTADTTAAGVSKMLRLMTGLALDIAVLTE